MPNRGGHRFQRSTPPVFISHLTSFYKGFQKAIRKLECRHYEYYRGIELGQEGYVRLQRLSRCELTFDFSANWNHWRQRTISP